MSGRFTESIVEDVGLSWFGELEYSLLHGPEIAPGELRLERIGFWEVVLGNRLKKALRRLNPSLPEKALEEAFRKVTVPQHPSLIANNRALHRMLVDGIAVECIAPSPQPSPKGRGRESLPRPYPEGRGSDSQTRSQTLVTRLLQLLYLHHEFAGHMAGFEEAMAFGDLVEG